MAPAITPLPVPNDARGVLLVGGTFDPPHKAHVELPRAIRDGLMGRGWWLVYVPAARNPLKASGPAASDAQRVEMLRLAMRRVPRCAVWTDEIDRADDGGVGTAATPARGEARPSYWVDTLARARDALAANVEGAARGGSSRGGRGRATRADQGPALRFLLGSDAAAAFHAWRRPREILALAEPVVMLRPPHRTGAGFMRAMRATGAWTPGELELWRSSVAELEGGTPLMPHAATDVRGAIARGDDAAARRALARPVWAYVRTHGLYGART